MSLSSEEPDTIGQSGILAPKMAMVATNSLEAYEDGEKIGEGSFGRVFKVRRRLDKRVFVRKEVYWGAMEPRVKQMLRDEVQLLVAIKHPNIVEFKEAFDNIHWKTLNIVMEYCSRGDLQQYIQKASEEQRMISEHKIWSIMEQLTAALFLCHKGYNHPDDLARRHGYPLHNGVRFLHRDLKPENVFIDQHGTIKLGDFGFCGVLEPGQRMRTTFLGTHAYMSPEVIKNEPYTETSDTWGLGCIIHELATLQSTFSPPGLNVEETSARIKNGWYIQIPGAYSEDLQKVIKKCLHTDQQNRPGMQDLVKNYRVAIARRERGLEVEFLNRKVILERQHQEAMNDLLRREEAVKVQKELLRDIKAQLDAKEATLASKLGKLTMGKHKSETAVGKGYKKGKPATPISENTQQDSAAKKTCRDKILDIKHARLMCRHKSLAKKQKELDQREALLSMSEAASFTQSTGLGQQNSINTQQSSDGEAKNAIKAKLSTEDVEASLVDSEEEEPTDIDEPEENYNEHTPREEQPFPPSLLTVGKSDHRMNIGSSFYEHHHILPFAEQKLRSKETLAGHGSGPMDIGGTFYKINGLPVSEIVL